MRRLEGKDGASLARDSGGDAAGAEQRVGVGDGGDGAGGGVDDAAAEDDVFLDDEAGAALVCGGETMGERTRDLPDLLGVTAGQGVLGVLEDGALDEGLGTHAGVDTGGDAAREGVSYVPERVGR